MLGPDRLLERPSLCEGCPTAGGYTDLYVRERGEVDFWYPTKLLVRRWRISLPLLLLTIVAVIVVGMTVRPDYGATSHVSLVAPAGADEGVARSRNPWLNTGLDSLATAAIITVQGKSVADGLAARGFSASYMVTLAGPDEPIVTIEVVAPTQAGATGTAREIARLLDQSVASIQADSGVAGPDLITTLPIRGGDNIEASSTRVLQAMITAGALGMLVTAAITIGWDALIRRRRRASRRAREIPRARETTAAGATTPPGGTATRTHARDAASAGWSHGSLATPSSLTTGRPVLAGSGVARLGGGREQEIHRVDADLPTHALSIDYRASGGHAAGEDEDGLSPNLTDPRSVASASDPIDSTIVLPLTAPSAWPRGTREG
jgi:hypothetical protein